MSDDEAEVTQDEAQAPDPDQDVAAMPVNTLFRYSTFVHLGDGAEECENGENGRCAEQGHFHAWLRLPNQFQHESIQAKARAARARLQRSLRDPESDAFIILEAEMDGLGEDATNEQLVGALLGITEMTDRLEAMRQVEGEEEFENHTEDVLRRREIIAMPDDEQPEDELAELVRQTDRYMTRVEAVMEEARTPKRNALENLPRDQLLSQVREQKIIADGNAAFTAAYTRWQWFTCTLRPVYDGRPQERVFKEMKDLDGAAPEVVDLLRNTFRDLDLSLQRASGNW